MGCLLLDGNCPGHLVNMKTLRRVLTFVPTALAGYRLNNTSQVSPIPLGARVAPGRAIAVVVIPLASRTLAILSRNHQIQYEKLYKFECSSDPKRDQRDATYSLVQVRTLTFRKAE